jgi:hypothetical protein
MLWTYGTRRWSQIGSLCQLLREPQGSLAHRLSLHSSCACAAETRSTHPRSLLQDRHAWSHLLRAVPVLLSHHWPSTCSRVACCLARAHACGIEPSRPSVLRRASDPRRAAPASTSAWVEGARRAWLHRGTQPPPTPGSAHPTALCHCAASPSKLATP